LNKDLFNKCIRSLKAAQNFLPSRATVDIDIASCTAFESPQLHYGSLNPVCFSSPDTHECTQPLYPDRRCMVCLYKRQVQLVCFIQGRSLKELEVAVLPNTGCTKRRCTEIALRLSGNAILFTTNRQQLVTIRSYRNWPNCCPPCSMQSSHFL